MAQESLWQRVFDAVKFRMQEIRTANGYETNVGAKCFAWRDLSRTPFTEAELSESLGGFILRDASRRTESGRVINTHDHTLQFEMVGACFASASSPPDNFARRMLCDVDRAIGQDIKWTVEGTPLARDTQPGEDVIEAAHAGERLVVVRKTFTVNFRTQRFDPYNQ